MSSVFPSSYSTLDSSALASLIAEEYGMADVKCRLITRGVGDTYLIESETDKYILRAYRCSHRSLLQITAEVELLIALEEGDVPVSYPIQDISGKFIQALNAVEGERHIVLFSYAPGQSVSVLRETQLRELGRQMARFHTISSVIELSDRRWNFDVDTTLFQPLAMLQDAFIEDPEGYAWMQAAANRVKEKLSLIGSSDFSIGYCHFDFLPKNFHFEGDSVTFFDFDFLGYGWLVNDIMTFWQHLCLDVHFGKIKQEEADNAYSTFLAGYKEVRSLSENELKAVPYLSLGFWLFYMGFHTTHDQFYPVIQPAQLKLRTILVRQLMKRYWPED
jgi:Ser/Thr protein kinase RdoA (MazF antagonist)